MGARMAMKEWRQATFMHLNPLINIRKSSVRKLQRRIQGCVRGLNLRGRAVRAWKFVDVGNLVVHAITQPCPYCEEPIQWNGWSLDHKKPVERGGTNAYDNVHVVCRRCNRAKGSVSDKAFKAILKTMRQYPRAYKELLARLSYGGSFHSQSRGIK
jgi:5-methylcytosine-specific restriction endonuclease McrA